LNKGGILICAEDYLEAFWSAGFLAAACAAKDAVVNADAANADAVAVNERSMKNTESIVTKDAADANVENAGFANADVTNSTNN